MWLGYLIGPSESKNCFGWSVSRASVNAQQGDCQAASNNALRSHARSRVILRYFFLTSQPQASTKAIEDIIRAIAASGIKVVMSTHDLGEARRIAGEIVLLHRGRVIESAKAAELLNSPKTEEARAFLAGELLV